MRKHAPAFAAICSLGLLACGPEPAAPAAAARSEASQPIINGEICDEATDPTAVAIIVDAVVDYGGFGGEQPMRTPICTGTVIAPDVILTAAHCLDATALTYGFGEVVEENYFVTFQADLTSMAEAGQGGGALPELPADATGSAGWTVHPGFDLEEMELGLAENDDIALLFLDGELAVRPMPVVTEAEASSIVEGASVRIAGWGQQTATQGFFEPPPPGSVGQKVCADAFVSQVGATEFKVGGDATTSRKCHGDSGGPSFLTLDGGETRVVGVTSHAYSEED